MKTQSHIVMHQPIPANVFDYGFNAYDQEQAWIANKGEIPGSS